MLNNWNINIFEFEFLQANYLYLLFLLPFIAWLLWKIEKNRKGDWKFTSSIANQQKLAETKIHWLRQVLIG
ncbi:MAG: hypothetical protein EBU01_13190, partial [Crocinitomicaceae bacterium]|nr:hypothetical protein [Crocinitomicaceae bacterium]